MQEFFSLKSEFFLTSARATVTNRSLAAMDSIWRSAVNRLASFGVGAHDKSFQGAAAQRLRPGDGALRAAIVARKEPISAHPDLRHGSQRARARAGRYRTADHPRRIRLRRDADTSAAPRARAGGTRDDRGRWRPLHRRRGAEARAR